MCRSPHVAVAPLRVTPLRGVSHTRRSPTCIHRRLQSPLLLREADTAASPWAGSTAMSDWSDNVRPRDTAASPWAGPTASAAARRRRAGNTSGGQPMAGSTMWAIPGWRGMERSCEELKTQPKPQAVVRARGAVAVVPVRHATAPGEAVPAATTENAAGSA